MKQWKTYQRQLIERYLNSLVGADGIIVWQQFGNSRIQFVARLREVSVKNCVVELSSKDVSKQAMEPAHPFYFFAKMDDLIFKKEKFQNFGNRLEFAMPLDIQLRDKRKNDRFSYKYQDHKNITFCSEARDINNSQQPEYQLACVLLDISVSGASFALSAKQRAQVKVGDELLLMNLTDQELPTPFKVKVRYIRPYNILDEGAFQAGIEFTNELDSVSYKSITSIIAVKAKRVAGLRLGEFCGLTFEEQVDRLNKIEMENRQLAINIRENLDQLDRIRYMTTQMKIEFLNIVELDLLATALRLSSKELIYDLMREVTETMQNEFIEKLAVVKPASGICKAQDQIVNFIRLKEASGEFVLDPKSFITFV